MTFKDAKKLHHGDEVILKRTKCPLMVINTEIVDKFVLIYCNDGNTYRHIEVF